MIFSIEDDCLIQTAECLVRVIERVAAQERVDEVVVPIDDMNPELEQSTRESFKKYSTRNWGNTRIFTLPGS